MNPLKRLASQTVIYGLSSILGRLLNYLLVPLYTRVFLPGEYGIVTEIYAYMALFFVILTYGMETALFNFSRKATEPIKVYSTALISVGLTSAGFLLLASLFGRNIAAWLDYQNHVEYIIYFALIVSLDAVTAIPFARLRQENRPVVFAVVKLVNIISNIFFNLYFLVLCPYLIRHYPGSGLSGVLCFVYNPGIGVGYVFISNFISSLLTMGFLLPWFRDIRWRVDPALWKQMLRYALPLAVMGLAGVINESFDRILLKHLLPSDVDAQAQLGIYGACAKIAILMTLFTQTFRFAFEPFFFQEAKKPNAKQTFAQVTTYYVILACVIFLGTLLFIDFVKHFIGEKYFEGLKVVPILLLAYLFLGLFFNLSLWYKLTDKTRFGARISIMGASISLVMYFIMIPLWGYVGSAWVHFFTYFSMMAVSWYWGRKYYPVPYQLKRIGAYVSLAVSIYLFHHYIPWPGTLLKNTAAAVLLLAFILGALMVERKHIREFI